VPVPTARRAALSALAAALLAGGCGDGDDPTAGQSTDEQIRTAFRTYTEALADKDYDKACDQLTQGSKAAIAEKLEARKVAVEKITGTNETPDDCPGQFKLLLGAELAGGTTSERTRDELLRASTKARIDQIDVDGDAGTVRVTVPLAGVTGVPAGTPPQRSTTSVRRESGKWKIDQR
jgi:hypothetical protein